jgi:hypothetical protein
MGQVYNAKEEKVKLEVSCILKDMKDAVLSDVYQASAVSSTRDIQSFRKQCKF